MAAIHYQLISMTFMRLCSLLIEIRQLKEECFFAALGSLDLRSLFSKVKTNNMMVLLSVQ